MGVIDPSGATLRERQSEDTRLRIVEAALLMLEESPQEPLAHEQVAKRAKIARRTIYRYFPSQADLLDAVWQESTRRLQLSRFPKTEADLLAAIEPVFRAMDENEALMRGLLASNAGQQMRQRDNEPRRRGVAEALGEATKHLSAVKRREVTGVFQALFSARTWDTMRQRAGLSEGEPSRAVLWAMKTLLAALYVEQQSKEVRAPEDGKAVRKSGKH